MYVYMYVSMYIQKFDRTSWMGFQAHRNPSTCTGRRNAGICPETGSEPAVSDSALQKTVRPVECPAILVGTHFRTFPTRAMEVNNCNSRDSEMSCHGTSCACVWRRHTDVERYVQSRTSPVWGLQSWGFGGRLVISHREMTCCYSYGDVVEFVQIQGRINS